MAGSTTVLPIVANCAEVFEARNPDIRIILNAGGSGVGINQAGRGNIDIGMASRDLTETERAEFAELRSHVIARDAVIPVVSSEVYDAGIRVMSLNQLAQIYRGSVQNWKELGGPDESILVIDKEGSRGTRHVFMEVVLGNRQAEAPGADLVLGSNNEEQTAIAQSNSAIGMLSHAWLNEQVKGLTLRMEDGALIEPSSKSISAGRFPITRELLLLTHGSPKTPAAEFIDFILSSEGQKIVEEGGYVPIG